MGITLQEIAEMAQVSRGTVDRVLHARGNVDSEKTKLILSLAREYGYLPNSLGQGLSQTPRSCKLGIVMPSEVNSFFIPVLDGVNSRAKELEVYGCEVFVRKLNGYHVDEQLSAIDSLVSSGVNALAIVPLNDERIRRKLESLKIPFATFNNDIDANGKMTYIGCNYFQSGQMIGELLGLIEKDTAQIGIVTGSYQIKGHNARMDGFKNVLAENYPHIQVVATEVCEDEDQIAYIKTAEMLKQYPEMDALYFVAGGKAGGCEAIQQSKRAVALYGYDSSDEFAPLIKNSCIRALVNQQPYLQGYRIVTTLFNKVFHQKMPRSILNMKSDIIMKYNV